MRIIDKTGPLANPADRDHCIQYMVAMPLIFGRLTAADYEDAVAPDPRVDALRSKMEVRENTHVHRRSTTRPTSATSATPCRCSSRTAARTERVHVDYPIGHRKRRAEGMPVLVKKFEAQRRRALLAAADGARSRRCSPTARSSSDAGARVRRRDGEGFLTGATLTDGARALGIELTTEQVSRLVRHLDLMDEWGARMNLTAIRDREQQLTKHVLDSLSVRPWLARRAGRRPGQRRRLSGHTARHRRAGTAFRIDRVHREEVRLPAPRAPASSGSQTSRSFRAGPRRTGHHCGSGRSLRAL